MNENNRMQVGTGKHTLVFMPTALVLKGVWVNFVFLLLSFFCFPREAQRVTMAADLHALLEV